MTRNLTPPFVKPPGNYLQRLESCTANFQHWIWENDLLINQNKSEVCVFGTGQKLSITPLSPTVTVAGCPNTSDKLKTLGVTFDAALTLRIMLTKLRKHAILLISRSADSNHISAFLDKLCYKCLILHFFA